MTDLKKSRERLSLTQVDVAKAVGVSLMTYQRYESGERLPNVRIAIRIANFLNSDLQELFKE